MSQAILEAKGEEVDAQLLLLDARDAKLRAWDAFERASEAYKTALWRLYDDFTDASQIAIENAAYGRLVEAVERVRAARQKEIAGYEKHSAAMERLRAAVDGETE